MKKILILLAISTLIFSGCGTQKEIIDSEINKNPTIESEIIEESITNDKVETEIIGELGEFNIVKNIDDSSISNYSFNGKEEELKDWKKQILQNKIDSSYLIHGYTYNEYNFISVESVKDVFTEDLIELYYEQKINTYPTEFDENNLGIVLSDYEIIDFNEHKMLVLEVKINTPFEENILSVGTEGINYNYVQQKVVYEYNLIKVEDNMAYLLVYQCTNKENFEKTKANVFFENLSTIK